MDVEVFMALLLFFISFFAVPLLIIAAIWFFFFGRRRYREKKSRDAFKGNEAAQIMHKDRTKARFLKTLGRVLWLPTGIAVFFLLPDAVESTAAAYIALGAAAAVSGCLLLWSRDVQARYNAGFKEHFVKAELTKVFDNLAYEPEGKFDQRTIRELKFFRVLDDLGGNDLIAADYNGLHFEQCDMRVLEEYEVTVEDKDGNESTEERWHTVFRGRAMRFDFAEAFTGKVQVVSKDFDAARVKQSPGAWQTVETELAEFDKYFDVYTQDPLDAMRVLTPQMIEGIFFLKQALDVPTALYFTEKTMFVFMSLSRDAFDVSRKKTLLEETELLERDIALMTGFMDVMYFKRPATPAVDRAETAATVNRAEIAASVAGAAGPFVVEKIVRQVRRATRHGLSLARWAIIAVYLVSAVYAYTHLPSEIVQSGDAPTVPTLGFLLVMGVFVILPPYLVGNPGLVFSLICLGIYLLFITADL